MGDVLVNLAEVLEVRDEALSEDEILALFIRAVAPLQALASEAMASHAFDCGFSPETFFLHVDGSIEVKPLHKDGVAPEFLPPEMVDSGDKQNDISQAYVYCLGAVLSYAQRYPNDESDSEEGAKNASPELLSLLNVMTVRDVNTRPTLTRLAQMGRQRAIERKIDPVKMVIDLHHSVMGDEQFDDDEDDDDDDPITGEYSLAVNEAPVRTAPAAAAATPLDASQAVRRKESEDDDTMSSNRASTPSAAVIGLDIDISEIGSPVGNSTELPAVNADDSLVVHPPDRDSWVSFDGTKLNDSTTTPRKESMLSSSGDEDAKKPTLDPFAYDRLQESLTASGRDPFSSDSNKTTPRRPGPLDGIMPQRRSVDLTSKNHDCVGGARSCHSLECQFCSPTHPQFGATTTANKSLPALEMVDGSPPIPAVREKKRKLLATPENLLLGAKTSGDRDPFASFEDLAHPDSSVNDRPPVSRLSSTASSSSASSSGSLKFDSIPPAGSIEALEKGAKRADNIPSSVDPEEPETRGTAGDPAARSAFPIDAQVVIEQPSTRALDDERAASKPTPAPRKTLPAVVERSSSASSVGSDDHFTQDTAPPSVLPTIDQAASRRDQDQQKNGSTPFGRRNSLASNRISGRATSTRRATAAASRKVSGMGGPEFLYKSRMPSIRLKAPPTRKRNNPLVRTDSSGVQVVLLSGQRVEVTCRTDAIASEIFDLVVAHTNLNEHYFFGLTVLKDGEHFFLEPHQRLSKFSPPGWKNQRKTQARNIFTLFLRLKYYPHSLEFIKTELTLHEMYLQLRRDVIDERMHANRDAAYQLAALALQAELGDRPNESTSYFHPNHYLPDRHLREEMGGEERIRSLLAELHSQYSGMSPREAEIELLKMCQAEREYGIHFHRVFRSKPSLNLGNTPLGDPETGTALWIGIMPRGIVVFEERSGTRVATSQHPWQETQTLQFDKKRFVIVGVTPKDGGEPKKTIFYTDDYKKSSYFVKFAAVQHRFMIKMRQWTATLQSDATKSRDMTSDLTAGVSVDRHANNLSTYSGKSSTDSGVPDLSREASPEEKLVPPSRTNKAKPMPAPLLIEDKPGVLNVSVPSTDRTLTELNNNDSISASFAARLDDSRATTTDGTEFDVVLSKDPQFGLGLTLVDGDLNGMKGVYVKSVTSGGPGDVQGGLRIGDRLISVNGVSLRGKNRHDTVNIVKQSESNVRMTVLRLRGLSSSAESLSSGSKPSQPPPAPPQSISKRVTDLRAAAASSRQRAVSDFGAAGDTLPTLKSEDIIADIQFRRRSNSMEKRPSSGSTSLDARQMTPAKSDSHLTAAAVKLRSNDRLPAPANHSNRSSVASTESSRSSGEYQMPKDALGARSDSPPNISSTIYGGFDPSDDSDAEATSIRAENASAARRTTTRSSSDDDADDDDAFGRAKRPNNVDPRRRDDSFTMNQLDWTDHIDIGDVSKDSDMVEEDVDEDWQEFDVTLSKNDRGGLGLQIAGGGKDKKHIYVKALVATPALTCDDIRPGDRLVSVNRLTTDGKTHQEVVELLKNATSPVTLGLARLLTRSESESDVDNVDGMQTLTVTLEKPASGSLGLSLAKLTGGVGIYVRVIAAGSVADLNGTLRVGDRLWEVNGESVADASPLEVVEKLKKAEGFVNLVFKRNKESVVS